MNHVLLVNPKFPHNIGGAVRAVSCFGGGEVRFTEERIKVRDLKRLPREERMRAFEDTGWSAVDATRPVSSILAEAAAADLTPVAIELLPSSEPLHTFEHPERALYVFGPEDGSLPHGTRATCHRFVTIPSFHCLNLAAAVYVTLYDRMVKRVAAGLDELPTVEGEARGWWYSPSLEGERI